MSRKATLALELPHRPGQLTDSYTLMWGLLAVAMVVVTAVTAQFRITAARR